MAADDGLLYFVEQLSNTYIFHSDSLPVSVGFNFTYFYRYPNFRSCQSEQ